MLRNLFAGSSNTSTRSNILASYLQAHATPSRKLAGMLAVFIVPVGALGWWCYSVVMSVGAMAPLQSASGASSNVTVSESSITSDTSVNPADVSSSSSTVNISDNVDIDVKNDQSQTTVEINGQPVPVAQEGTTHKVIQHDNGQTTVDISIDSDASGRTTSRSSTDINLRSSSSSDVDIRSKEIR